MTERFFEAAEIVSTALAATCRAAADTLIEWGFHPIFAVVVFAYLYFGTMMAPLLILKMLCPGLWKKRKEEGC